MKKLNKQQIEYLIRLVKADKNDVIAPSPQKWCSDVLFVLTDMLSVLPTQRAADANQRDEDDSNYNNVVRDGIEPFVRR